MSPHRELFALRYKMYTAISEVQIKLLLTSIPKDDLF